MGAIMKKIRITEQLRRKITDRASRSRLRDPVVGLIHGHWEGDNQSRFHLAFYERDQIPTDDPVEIVDAGGLEILIVQEELLPKLEHGRLGLEGGVIVILE